MNDLELLPLARKIIGLGGRATTIEAILKVNKKTAGAMYKHYTSQNPRGGLLPWDPYWAVKSPSNCLHTSYFIAIYQSLQEANQQEDLKNIFVSAFSLYNNVIAESHNLEIDRAWHVMLQFNTKNIYLKKCKCGRKHVAATDSPEIFQLCPICDVLTDTRKRKRWVQRL